MDKQSDFILEHYRRIWGRETSWQDFEVAGDTRICSISTVTFAPQLSETDWVVATVGGHRNSTKKQPSQTIDKTELFIYSSFESSELSLNMSNLGAYCCLHNTVLSYGHTIVGNQGSGIVSGSPLSEILLLPPYFIQQEFSDFHLPGLLHVSLLWVIPIHLVERQYIKKNGYKRFVELLFDNSVDVTDFQRAPLVAKNEL
jgi:hypothetical protein